MSTAAASPGFICKLKDRKEVAEGTRAFRFEKPSGWEFKAGQYIDMTLLDPRVGRRRNVRSFSIASAPHEDTLMVATRMRDAAFKRVLRTMPIGAPIRIEGPCGDLILQKDLTRAAVFPAGGIGITPFRSIVHWAAKEKLPQRVFLFYSNRRPEDSAELVRWPPVASLLVRDSAVCITAKTARRKQPPARPLACFGNGDFRPGSWLRRAWGPNTLERNFTNQWKLYQLPSLNSK
jgi:ferredoxin-NADP reductase